MGYDFDFIDPIDESLDFTFGECLGCVYFDFTEADHDPSYDFNFGPLYKILKGLTNNFIAIWADPTAGLYSGKFYVASENEFSIINSAIHDVEDYYTTSHSGTVNEALKAEDIVDLNVGR